MRARLCRHSLESASSQSEAVCDAHCARSVHAAGRTPSYWPYDQVVTECLILRPRAMQVINCASWHGQQRRQVVARRDSMAAIRRIPGKIEKIGACGGPWDPISPPHGHPLGPPRRPRGEHLPRLRTAPCRRTTMRRDGRGRSGGRETLPSVEGLLSYASTSGR